MTTPPFAATLDELAAEVDPRRLATLVAGFQGRYRTVEGTGRALDRADAIAYAVYRMPATFAAVVRALTETQLAIPEWRPASAIDVGAGTGAAAWALATTLPSLTRLTLVDRDVELTRLGRRLAISASHPALREADWLSGDIRPESSTAVVPSADLAVASYALGELPDAADAARSLTSIADTVVVVEPGTPRGYATVLAARRAFVETGMHVAAPCPHDGRCPMEGNDWCHFAVRLPRSAAHRRAKGGTLGYEDEKFSYVAASRLPVQPARGRVVRHPQFRPGHVSLEVCALPPGLRTDVVTKRRGAAYKLARDVRWGDRWDEPQ